MERLIQQFEKPVTDATGKTYRVFVYGRSRPADTWQGWLVFERIEDARHFATGVETTQPNAEALVYWASGLSEAYFDGALKRAMDEGPTSAPVIVPPPLVGDRVDATTRAQRLASLESEILATFQRLRSTRLQTQVLFDALPHAHADVVRALEDLEKQGGLVTRRTEEGNDWVFLTELGVRVADLRDQARAGLASPEDGAKVR